MKSNNVTEFINQQCIVFFKSYGMLDQRTCPYSPQQNGVVERKHKHLLQVARALMFASNLLKHFWGDGILTATYLINRMPSKVLKWKAPYEILFGKIPNSDHLKIFDCLCFATNVRPHNTNLNKEL